MLRDELICCTAARHYSFISQKFFFIFIILFHLSAFFQSAAASSTYSGSDEDLFLIESIHKNGQKFISNRSILSVENGYLADDKIDVLHEKIDKAIGDIENFIGLQFDKDAYGEEKIEYFVHSGRVASHTITGYQPGKYMHPVVFLSFASEKNAPYVHETVHIIAWDWSAPWLEEGLAVFLNDELSGYPSFPNYGEDLDTLAKSMLVYTSALQKIDRNEIPEFPTREERRAYYILSGSFVKYVYNVIGIEKLMRIYKAEDTRKAFAEITGKTLNRWKNEWLQNI